MLNNDEKDSLRELLDLTEEEFNEDEERQMDNLEYTRL